MATATDETIQTISIVRELEIEAPIDVAFEAVLAELGPDSEMPDGTAFPFLLEAWPGGRWYRDLGNGAGHLWGHVQVIKPPVLLELCGPLFMSYPATNFIQYRLTAHGDRTQLKFTHQAFGQIPSDHREGVGMGWNHGLERIRQIAARMKSEVRSKR